VARRASIWDIVLRRIDGNRLTATHGARINQAVRGFIVNADDPVARRLPGERLVALGYLVGAGWDVGARRRAAGECRERQCGKLPGSPIFVRAPELELAGETRLRFTGGNPVPRRADTPARLAKLFACRARHGYDAPFTFRGTEIFNNPTARSALTCARVGAPE
jgi:hypothetical protein